jgi:hypothetical protein
VSCERWRNLRDTNTLYKLAVVVQIAIPTKRLPVKPAQSPTIVVGVPFLTPTPEKAGLSEIFYPS